MTENKNGLPQQPESTQENDTTSKPKLRCPINKYILACRADCAWYIESERGAVEKPYWIEGCALKVMAESLVTLDDNSHYLKCLYDMIGGGRL